QKRKSTTMQFKSPGPHVRSKSPRPSVQFKSPRLYVQSKPKRSTAQFKSPGSLVQSNISVLAAQTQSPAPVILPKRAQAVIEPPTMPILIEVQGKAQRQSVP